MARVVILLVLFSLAVFLEYRFVTAIVSGLAAVMLRFAVIVFASLERLVEREVMKGEVLVVVLIVILVVLNG